MAENLAQLPCPACRSIDVPEAPCKRCGNGSLIGRYQIRGKLGSGAHATVFLADDPHLDRQVALKVLKERRNIGDWNEAIATRSLRHPAIVSVWEADQVGGRPYLACEYVEGQSLAVRLEQVASEAVNDSAEQVAVWVVALAEGLQHVHESGVIHGDVTPNNIIVDAKERPHLFDFGLAVIQRDGGAGELNTTNEIAGTPAFMSPEQARGEPLTPATDQYSLGAVMFAMLTGHAAHQGDRRVVVADVANRPAPACHAGPGDLAAICDRARAFRIEDRYASIQEFAADIRRWQRGEPTMARPLSTWRRLKRWRMRQPALAASFGLATAALLTVTIICGVLAAKAAERAKLATQREAHARREADETKTAVALARDKKAEADAAADDARRRQEEAESAARTAQQFQEEAQQALRTAENTLQQKEAAIREAERLAQAETQAAQKLQNTVESLRPVQYQRAIGNAAAALREQRTAEADALLNSCDPALIGWEWRHLKHEIQRRQRKKFIPGEFQRAAANYDGSRVATLNKEQLVIWDTTPAEPSPLHSLQMPSEYLKGFLDDKNGRPLIGKLLLSPSGNTLAATCHIENQLHQYLVHNGKVVPMDYPLQKQLNGDGVLDRDDPEAKKNQSQPVQGNLIGVSADKRTIITSLGGNKLRISRGKATVPFPMPSHSFAHAALLPGNDRVYVQLTRGLLGSQISGRPKRLFLRDDLLGSRIAFFDNKLIVIEQSRLSHLDPLTGETLLLREGSNFTLDGQLELRVHAVGHENANPRETSGRRGVEMLAYAGPHVPVRETTPTRPFVVAPLDNIVHVATGTTREGRPNLECVSSDGAWGGILRSGRVHLWNAPSNKLTRAEFPEPVEELNVGTDGRLLASTKNAFILWRPDATDGNHSIRIDRKEDETCRLVLDDRIVIWKSGRPKHCMLYDDNATLLATIPLMSKLREPVVSVDGRWLGLGSTVCDARSGRELLRTPSGHVAGFLGSDRLLMEHPMGNSQKSVWSIWAKTPLREMLSLGSATWAWVIDGQTVCHIQDTDLTNKTNLWRAVDEDATPRAAPAGVRMPDGLDNASAETVP